MMKLTVNETAEFLLQHDNYAILSHRRPDGDTLGSTAALCRILRNLGKTAHVIENNEVTPRYQWLHQGLTKKEAESLGWVSKEGNLWEVAEGMSIGGDYFGNYEGLLPEGKYRECDIDYDGGYRGEERLIYTTQGDLYIYYTDDHYESFELIYAEGE